MSAILIIGGKQEETQEQTIRRIIQNIYSRCYLLDKYKLDVAAFKSNMLETLDVDDIDTYEMLKAYEKLSDEEKDKLIESCTLPKPHLDNDFSLGSGKTLAMALNKEAYREKHLYIKSDLYELSDAHLKKLIKRSKNPLEKQALQRQLADCNYMCGKHRKGKKHGR